MVQTNAKVGVISNLPNNPAGAKSVTSPEVLIAVIGQTGSGKSTFINLATQSERKLLVGDSISSCTNTVDVAPSFNLDGRPVILYDTPGFNDTNKSEEEILRIIAAELENQYRKGSKLHGVIYLHRVSDIGVGGLKKANFGIFKKLCDDTSLKNIVIVTNMWSLIPSKEGKRRVRELTTMNHFFKPALAKGAQMIHHKNDTADSAHDIIRAILRNHPAPLSTQQEIVDEGKYIDKTSTGVEVDKKLNALREEYEKKLREQLEAAEQTRKERDEETRQELLEESRKARVAIVKLTEEKARQVERYKRLQKEYDGKRQEDAKRRQECEDAFRKQLVADLEQERREFENRFEEMNQQLALQSEGANRVRWNILVSRKELAERNRAGKEEIDRLNNQLILLAITPGECHSVEIEHDKYLELYPDNTIASWYQTYKGSSRQKWRFFKSGQNWKIQCTHDSQYLTIGDRYYTTTVQGEEHKIVPNSNWKEFRIVGTSKGTCCSHSVIKRRD